MDCGSCSGKCSACCGCVKELTLTEGEASVLRELAQIPFLPIARRADSEKPVYLEQTDYTAEEYSMILLCLEKKGLVSLDYDKPLSGFDYCSYENCPVCGSMGLTARGQAVIDLLQTQGAREEVRCE